MSTAIVKIESSGLARRGGSAMPPAIIEPPGANARFYWEESF
jgi:hypothetical protein